MIGSFAEGELAPCGGTAARTTDATRAAPSRTRSPRARRFKRSATLGTSMPRWFLSNSPGYIRVAQDPGDAFTPVAAFTTRTGGSSAAPFDSLNLSEGVGDDTHAVRANRARVLGALGLDPAHVAS